MGRSRSSGGRSLVKRSGYVSAYWIGNLMSVTPSCASKDPSSNSTIEWIVD